MPNPISQLYAPALFLKLYYFESNGNGFWIEQSVPPMQTQAPLILVSTSVVDLRTSNQKPEVRLDKMI